MKKIFAIFIVATMILASLSLIACDGDLLGSLDSGNDDTASGNIPSGGIPSGSIDSGDINTPSIKIDFIADDSIYASSILTEEGFDFPIEPSKIGFVFDGWFFDKDTWQNQLTSQSLIEQNVSVYAKWTKISATITYDNQKSSLENGFALQTAIDNAEDNTVVLVEEGIYDVTHKGANDGVDYDHNLVISNDNVRIQGIGEVIIVSSYTSGIEDAQQTVTVKADNVCIQNLNIYPVENYPDRSKTFAIISGNNVTVKECTVFGTIYVGSPEVGKYTIVNNTVKNYAEIQKTSINIANGAGSAMLEEENAIIENNNCEGAILLLGVRENNWDNNNLTRLPIIKNNTFGSVYKQERLCYLLIGADIPDSIAQTTIDSILSENHFTGKVGAFECYDFEFYGTYYSYWY